MKFGEILFLHLLIVLHAVGLVHVNAAGEDPPKPADVVKYMYNFFSSLSSEQIKNAYKGRASLPEPKDGKPITTSCRTIKTPEDLKELDDKIEEIIIKKNEEELASNNNSDPWWHVWKWSIWKNFKLQNTTNCPNLIENLPPTLQAKLDTDPRLEPDTLYLVPVKETKSNCSWWQYIGSFFSTNSSGQYIVNNGTLFNPPEDVPAPFKIVKGHTEKSAKPIDLEPYRFTTLIDYYKSGKKKDNEESEEIGYFKKATKFLYDYIMGF